MVIIPRIDVQISDVEIKRLGYNRTGGDCPVRPVRSLLLVVAFEKDTGIDYVDFFDAGVIDIVEEAIEKEVKVFPASWPSIVKMVRSYTIEVMHSRLHFL